MKIAVLSDIHGNYIALQKCLEHSLEQEVDAFIFLGDYLGEFPEPQKTLNILKDIRNKYPCIFIRGNKEDYWINRRKDVNCDWKNGNHSIMAMINNYENLNGSDIDYFESMPISRTIKFDGLAPILACHGTPFENRKKLLPDDKNLYGIIKDCKEKYIVCGHTHIQGLVFNGNKKVINAGAVGVPLHSPKKTQYTIMESSPEGWDFNFYSLEYNVDKAIDELKSSRLWDKSPYWCRITEHLLYTGELAHGEVLNYVMKINDYKDPWYNIDETFWDRALIELGI